MDADPSNVVTHDAAEGDKSSGASGKSTVDSDEYLERAAVPLRRKDDDDESYTSQDSSSKRKVKSKKPREQVIALDLQYANKPTGASSLSRFVGDDDWSNISSNVRGFDINPAFSQPRATYQSSTATDDAFPAYWDGQAVPDIPAVPCPPVQIKTVPAVASMSPVPSGYGAWSTDDGTTAPVAVPVPAYPMEHHPVQNDGNGQSQLKNSTVQYDAWSTNDGSIDPVSTPAPANPIELQSVQNGGNGDMVLANWEDEKSNSYDAEDEDDGEMPLHDDQFYEQELQHCNQELLNAKVAAESMKKAYRTQVDQLKSERDQVEQELKNLRSSYASDVQRFVNEKKKHVDETDKRKEKLAKAQSMLEEKNADCESLADQISELKLQNAALERAVKEAANKPCGCNIDVNGVRQRAMDAEISLLKLKREVEIRNLERARRDAEFIIAQLAKIIEKASEDDEQRMLDYRDQWLSNLQQLTDQIVIVGKLFDDQINLVQSDIPLSSLQPIVVPTPPPAPPPPNKPRMNAEAIEQTSNQRGAPLDENSGLARTRNGTGSAFEPVDARSRRDSSSSSAGESSGRNSFRSATATTPPRPMQPPPGFRQDENMQPIMSTSGQGGIEQRYPEPQSSILFRPISSSPLPQSPPRSSAGSASATGMASAMSHSPQSNSSSATAPKPTGAPGEKKQTKVDMLVQTVAVNVPHVSRDEIMKGIELFRSMTPNNSLKGIQWDDLVRGVCACLKQMYPAPKLSKPSVTGFTPPPAPVGSRGRGRGVKVGDSASATVPKPQQQSLPPRQATPQQQNYDDPALQQDDECFICLHKLSEKKTLTMECKHVAHDACLQKWFTQHMSCPVCRCKALPPDEYPALC